jgi:hypothetical protein
MDISTMKAWAERAVLPLAVLLFVDLCLDWHRALVSVGGSALHMHGDTSALAGWGVLAAIAIVGLIVWEAFRVAGAAPADRQGSEMLSAALAFSAFVFTVIEFFSGSARVDVAGMANVSAGDRLWPAYAGLGLAALLALAAIVQLARPVKTDVPGLRERTS